MDRHLLPQRLIALPFGTLRAWCLLFPHGVERLVFNPTHQHLSATSALMIGCFGAQALLCGLFTSLRIAPRERDAGV